MPESDNLLACFAAREIDSRGRLYQESKPKYRGEFQRDRDRIIHSSAFRRLVYKTQVFVNHEGDLYRTRLTHSIEVSQIARTLAQSLKLNEVLIEAMALAHDLGHTPFGHAGQDTLNKCMQDFGGFEHNLQSLRVVDQLESKYAEFDGLNLTFETREGILKHCSLKNAQNLGDIGKRFIERQQPGLEAQLVNIADAIAYNHHDIDDGYRAGLITLDQLMQVGLFRQPFSRVKEKFPKINERRLIHETLRQMISNVVNDLITNTNFVLKRVKPKSIEDIRLQKFKIAKFSENINFEHLELKKFLNSNLYKHPRGVEMTDQAETMVKKLFERYMSDYSVLPENIQNILQGETDKNQARKISDYIAGMTDRFAIAEYERLI